MGRKILMGARRGFLTKSYPTMKKHNPHTPIMLREASGTEPKVYARYGASNCSLYHKDWREERQRRFKIWKCLDRWLRSRD